MIKKIEEMINKKTEELFNSKLKIFEQKLKTYI